MSKTLITNAHAPSRHRQDQNREEHVDLLIQLTFDKF